MIPWRLDVASIEEDVFNLAAAQPPAQRRLTIAGCRQLALQFRERVEAQHAGPAITLGRKGDWVVLAAWLLLLRSRLLLPVETQPDAAATEDQLRDRFVALLSAYI